MSSTKAVKRLETDIQKLNSIINSLVEENYMLKEILSQTQQPPASQRKQKQS